MKRKQQPILPDSNALSPERLRHHHRTQRLNKKSKASREGTHRQVKKDTQQLIVSLLNVYKAIDKNPAALTLYPFTPLALSAATYMKQKRPELQTLCRMNHLMVSGTKAELVLKLLRCELHGSVGNCPTCGHSKLQLEYLDAVNPTLLPRFVECKHYYGVRKQCPYGRRPIATAHPFQPMITTWPNGKPPPTPDKTNLNRVRIVTDGYKGAFYLNVKYKDKDRAKENGARWDRQNRLWYVPMELVTHDMAKFERWVSDLVVQQVEVEEEEEEEEEEYPSSYA